jgi:hypothetical protein
MSMDRFDRSDSRRDVLGSALGAATDELKASLEREVRELVDAAKKRASEIEDEASRRAEAIERDARRSAKQAHQGEAERLSAMREAIERLERAMSDALPPLRAEAERLVADRPAPTDAEPPSGPELDRAISPGEPPRPAETEQPAPREPTVEQAPQPQPPAAAPAPPKPKPAAIPSATAKLRTEPAARTGPEAPPSQPPPIDAERMQMIRDRLLAMREQGASRVEAEEFLTRVGAHELLGLLTQIYSQEGPGQPAAARRGLLRRRRN